jgi:tRNA A37 methylthiotransferase MiaB
MVEGQSKLVKQPAYPRSGGVELGWERTSTLVRATPVVQLMGRTRGDQVVAFEGDASLKGQLINVEIVDAKNLTLFGRVPAPASVN